MSRRLASSFSRNTRASAGFTLIELMVAMLLGLIVIGGVVSVFLANQRTYRTNQALGDVQDGSRTAFEMMARDIRDASLTGCTNNGRVANVLNQRTTAWWANWNNAVMGYGGSTADPATGNAFGTAAATRLAGTDSLMLLGGQGSGVSVKINAEPSGTFTLNESSADLNLGDVMIVCDPDHATLVQITAPAAGTLTHAANSGATGNCGNDLSFPTVCASTSSYVFVTNSQVSKLTAADWYIGTNPAGGNSLYRVGLDNSAAGPTTSTQEMVRDVTAMAITYHQTGTNDFVTAAIVTNWALVDAVQVTLTLESVDKKAGTDVKAISRTFTATTTIRNRVI